MSENFLHQQNNLDKAMIPITKPHATSLSITALVLGIVAILGSWIPFFNLISIVIGILAITFGIICLVNANRKHISKDFPLIGIVLGSLTILISLFITLGSLYLISTVESEIKPTLGYDLKTDNLPNKPIEDMTNDEFLTAYHTLADDYENLVEDFEQDPYDTTVNDQIITLSTRWSELLSRLHDIYDELSNEEFKQILEDDKRISIAIKIFNQVTPEDYLPAKSFGV